MADRCPSGRTCRRASTRSPTAWSRRTRRRRRRTRKIPPVFTYFGQFIDHDLTANTDRDSAISFIDGAITPAARSDVEANLVNLRTGSLGLDSLYGDDPGQGAFATKLANLMRFPTNTAKMRLALAAPVGGRVPLPSTDSATDLLRLGFLIRNGLLTVDELKALVPPELRNQFIDKATDQPILARAIIGDARNDENLIVAQLQVLFLRLHNKIADATGSHSFEKVRRLTRWHYQWLVVNSYLKTVCDPAIVDEVVDMEAPLYAAFFQQARVGRPEDADAAGVLGGGVPLRPLDDPRRLRPQPLLRRGGAGVRQRRSPSRR